MVHVSIIWPLKSFPGHRSLVHVLQSQCPLGVGWVFDSRTRVPTMHDITNDGPFTSYILRNTSLPCISTSSAELLSPLRSITCYVYSGLDDFIVHPPLIHPVSLACRKSKSRRYRAFNNRNLSLARFLWRKLPFKESIFEVPTTGSWGSLFENDISPPA